MNRVEHRKAIELSLPTRERGLKQMMQKFVLMPRFVAPHAGAWIETSQTLVMAVEHRVAPHAGAWIETHCVPWSRPTRRVAPHAGAWIETFSCVLPAFNKWSLPTRERGLKQHTMFKLNLLLMSLPTRERGLKQPIGISDNEPLMVAPHAGAWIETFKPLA